MTPPLIFIVGSARSGTTMLNRILGNHSQVLGLNELHFFGNEWVPDDTADRWGRKRSIDAAARLLATARRSLWDARPTDAEYAESERIVSSLHVDGISPGEVYGGVMSHLLNEAGRQYAVDQTPRNIFYAHNILKMYPDARIVHLIRDPRAVLLSQKNRWRQRWLGAEHIPWSNVLRVFVNYHPFTTTKLWIAAYEHGAKLRSHPRYYPLRFEDLVGEPEKQISRLCQFIGVAFEPNMLDIPFVGSSNRDQVSTAQGITKDVTDVWRTKLPAGDVWICERLAGKYLVENKYEPEGTRLPLLAVLGYAALYPLHLLGVLAMNPRIALQITAVLRRFRQKTHD